MSICRRTAAFSSMSRTVFLESGDAVEQEFRESMEHRLEKGYVLPGMTKILFSCQEIAGFLSGRNSIGLCTLENCPRTV